MTDNLGMGSSKPTAIKKRPNMPFKYFIDNIVRTFYK